MPLGNDEWRATFTVGGPRRRGVHDRGVGRHFATWRQGLAAKVQAGQDVSSELLEGAAPAAGRGAPARRGRSPARSAPRSSAASADARDRDCRRARPAARRRAPPPRRIAAGHRGTSACSRVLVDRERARFGSWYEMFPRSARHRPDPQRDVPRGRGARCRAIAAMGFDVALPAADPPDRPHASARGRNNTLDGRARTIRAARGPSAARRAGTRPSSPALGTLEDFDHFVGGRPRLPASRSRSTSPTSAHPITRGCASTPSGSGIGPTARSSTRRTRRRSTRTSTRSTSSAPTWRSALAGAEARRRVLVRARRAHLPRGQPAHQVVPLLGVDDCRRAPPVPGHDLPRRGVHAAERSCATWRRSASTSATATSRGATRSAELTEYFTELTQTEVVRVHAAEPVREHARHPARVPAARRPHAFRIRLVLAATLGASYGIYSGFELCENVPVRPGSRGIPRLREVPGRGSATGTRPDSLAPLITRVNAAAPRAPGAAVDRGLRFFGTDNPQLLCYAKVVARRNAIASSSSSASIRTTCSTGCVQAPIADVQACDRRRVRGRGPADRRPVPVAGRVELRPADAGAPAARPAPAAEAAAGNGA